MATLFPGCLVPALDSNGSPISGATWNFYQTGTTTPLAVQNAAGTSLGTSVTADSAGRFVPIYLNPSYTYRAILKDAQGSTISGKDIDPVNSEGGVTLSVEDFGAVGDDSTDNDTAFANWAAALQSAGGGIGIIPPGTYRVSPTLSAALMTFTSVNGLTILCQGVIKDTNTYTGTQEATLFKFVGCSDLDLDLRVTTQVAVTTTTTALRGLRALYFEQGCQHIDIDLDLTGGLAGVQFARAVADPTSYRSRDIMARINASGAYYPWLCQFSGNDADVTLFAEECGRPFFIYGVAHQNIDVRSKNQQVTSLIKAFNGVGCGEIEVKYWDLESDACQSSAPLVALEWGDSTAAEHRNIAIDFNVSNPATGEFGNTFEINKYSDGGSTADSTGRGHTLNGLTITGYSDQSGGGNSHLVQTAGTFTSPDAFSNIQIDNLRLIGTTSQFALPLRVLSDRAVFVNVTSNGGVYTDNTTNGRVTFIGCTAATFTSATNNTDRHTYIDCNITDDTNFSPTNKLFVNTYVEGVLRSDVLTPGRNFYTATKVLSGDLTGTNNIFFVNMATAGIGAYFRLTYHLVADQADTDPLTRDVTMGVKSFNATLNGSGVWTSQIAAGNEVTERTLGTASAVTVSLVNGTSAGAHVAVSCTNYNGANARGAFVLEMIPAVASGFSLLEAV